mmetsp:Transcript_7725/g.20590  ORF Transcript_7725/g.20590 Transcript_7725/m.20590 type:complete len:385 (+) Transcript_7725:1644-2798(+)
MRVCCPPPCPPPTVPLPPTSNRELAGLEQEARVRKRGASVVLLQRRQSNSQASLMDPSPPTTGSSSSAGSAQRRQQRRWLQRDPQTQWVQLHLPRLLRSPPAPATWPNCSSASCRPHSNASSSSGSGSLLRHAPTQCWECCATAASSSSSRGSGSAGRIPRVLAWVVMVGVHAWRRTQRVQMVLRQPGRWRRSVQLHVRPPPAHSNWTALPLFPTRIQRTPCTCRPPPHAWPLQQLLTESWCPRRARVSQPRHQALTLHRPHNTLVFHNTMAGQQQQQKQSQRSSSCYCSSSTALPLLPQPPTAGVVVVVQALCRRRLCWQLGRSWWLLAWSACRPRLPHAPPCARAKHGRRRARRMRWCRSSRRCCRCKRWRRCCTNTGTARA